MSESPVMLLKTIPESCYMIFTSLRVAPAVLSRFLCVLLFSNHRTASGVWGMGAKQRCDFPYDIVALMLHFTFSTLLKIRR